MHYELERIRQLQKQKGWTEYQLANASGLTQSTISSWYRKNMHPSIPSLERICEALGITLSQFFSEGDSAFSLTPTQKKLIDASGTLSEEQQLALIHFLNSL